MYERVQLAAAQAGRLAARLRAFSAADLLPCLIHPLLPAWAASPCLPPPPIAALQVEGAADCEGDVPRPVGVGQPGPRGIPDGRQRGRAQAGQGEGPALSQHETETADYEGWLAGLEVC
jgi:hypothetical protein